MLQQTCVGSNCCNEGWLRRRDGESSQVSGAAAVAVVARSAGTARCHVGDAESVVATYVEVRDAVVVLVRERRWMCWFLLAFPTWLRFPLLF